MLGLVNDLLNIWIEVCKTGGVFFAYLIGISPIVAGVTYGLKKFTDKYTWKYSK